MNDSGVDRRPTNNEREKFSVANVARNMPKSSRENDCRRRYCWGVRGDWRLMRIAKTIGKEADTIVNRRKYNGRSYIH